jgi:hypothetical protein
MRYWIIAVLLAALGCTRQDSGSPDARINDPYEQWVVEQLGLITKPSTLGDWKKERPGDAVVLYRHGDAGAPLDRPWCARAETAFQLPDGTTAVRYAFFYPPDPPARFALPAENETAGLIDRACTLGVIWTERSEKDKARGEQIAAAVRAALDQRFGEGKANAKLQFFNAASWSETGRWKPGDATMASASERGYDKSQVLAFGFLPVSGLSIDELGRDSREDIEQSPDPGAADVRLLTGEAGIPGAARDALLAAVSRADDWREGRIKSDAQLPARQLISGLKQWLAAAEKLEGRRKAAALLAADLALEGSQYAYKVADPDGGAAARKELVALGADFNDSPLGGVTSYTRSWLKAARELDRDGPIGDRCFRMLMAKGFDTSGTCSSGNEQFREVIEEGERYLAGKYDPAAQAEVELMLADAYRDIVSLAAGAAADYGEASAYAGQADQARQKAILHYRKALANARDDRASRKRWDEAWRLINGVPPAYLRYYCIYD